MTNTGTTAQVAIDTLSAFAAKQDTAVLFNSLEAIAAMETTTDAERMTRAAIRGVIEDRHNLADALDAIYMDENFGGSYDEALMQAYVQVVA